jgi:SAM-dependent methyltransferase
MTSAAQDRHLPGTTRLQQLRRHFKPGQRLFGDGLPEYLADGHRSLLGLRSATPSGIDLSAAMLGYGRARLPVALGDAARLPVRSSCLSAVISVMTHTDMPDYPAVLAEVTRVLRPGGRFVHIGVHPCFCGGFADRGNPSAVVIRPGYLDGRWTKASWTAHGVRARVGATHLSLPSPVHAFLDVGLAPERLAEGGEPTPVMLAIRARKRP